MPFIPSLTLALTFLSADLKKPVSTEYMYHINIYWLGGIVAFFSTHKSAPGANNPGFSGQEQKRRPPGPPPGPPEVGTNANGF